MHGHFVYYSGFLFDVTLTAAPCTAYGREELELLVGYKLIVSYHVAGLLLL